MKQHLVGISIFSKFDASVSEQNKKKDHVSFMRNLARKAIAEGFAAEEVDEEDDDDSSSPPCLYMKIEANSNEEAYEKAQAWGEVAVIDIKPHDMEIVGIAPGATAYFVH